MPRPQALEGQLARGAHGVVDQHGAALEGHAFLIVGDHSQSPIGEAPEAAIALEKVLTGFSIIGAGGCRMLSEADGKGFALVVIAIGIAETVGIFVLIFMSIMLGQIA